MNDLTHEELGHLAKCLSNLRSAETAHPAAGERARAGQEEMKAAAERLQVDREWIQSEGAEAGRRWVLHHAEVDDLAALHRFLDEHDASYPIPLRKGFVLHLRHAAPLDPFSVFGRAFLHAADIAAGEVEGEAGFSV